MRPLIVGISGKQQSGKTTLAEYMAIHHGAMLAHFKAPVLAAARRVGVPDDHLQRKPDQVRTLLQAIGPALDLVKPDWRATYMAAEVRGLLAVHGKSRVSRYRPTIVVDDVRLPCEVQTLVWLASEHGCDLRLVRMERVGFDRSDFPGVDHPTETDLDDFDAWDHVLEISNGRLGPETLARAAGMVLA